MKWLWVLLCLPIYLNAAPSDLAGQEATQVAQNLTADAIEHWQAALAQETDTGKQIDLMLRLATAYQQLGLYPELLAVLNQAILSSAVAADIPRAAAVLSAASDAWLINGDLTMALRMADKSLALARQSHDPALLASSLNQFGNAAAVLDEYPDAFDAYQESMAVAQAAQLWNLHARAAINRFKSLLYYGDNNAVVAALQVAEAALAKLDETREKAPLLLTFGSLIKSVLRDDSLTASQRSTAQAAAFNAFQAAATIAEANQDHRSRSIAYGRLAEIYETRQRYADALQLNQQALFFAHQDNYPDIGYVWEWQQGRLLKALGRYADALQAYRQAVATLQPIRQNLSIGYRMPDESFDEAVRPVYYGLADLLLHQASQTQDPQAQQSLLKAARDAVEALKLAELQDYFKDECVAAFQNKTANLDSIAATTAIIYPIPLPDRLALLLSIGGTIHPVIVPVPAQDINANALLLRARLQTRNNNTFLEPAHKLYRWLVEPLLPYLHGVDTLVFVPDGRLRLFPMSTLHDGKQFLVENFALAVVPGLSLLDPKAIEWRHSEIMLVGLSDAVQGYPPLPNVPSELATIQEIVGHGDKILNAQYTLDSFRELLKSTDFAAIHMATHGEFSADPEHTYLLTYDGKMTMDKLQDVIGLGKFRDKAVELLTLSACRTGVGDERSALGLAGVAVKAGARSAVATLWFVDDEATAMSMKRFYKEMVENPGLSKAKALQRVQTSLIGQARYWHPSYWGPFLLIGNWL